jgi:hypothetical protein
LDVVCVPGTQPESFQDHHAIPTNADFRETAKKVSHFRSLAEHVKPRLVSLSGLNAFSAGFVPGLSG